MGTYDHLARQAGYTPDEFGQLLDSLATEFCGVDAPDGAAHCQALAALAMHGPSVPYFAAALRRLGGVNADLLDDVHDNYYSPGV